MLAKWPIRNKLLLGLALLLVIVATFSVSGLYASYSYRSTLRILSSRANELPPAMDLIHLASQLRVSLHDARPFSLFADLGSRGGLVSAPVVRADFRKQLDEVYETVGEYRSHLEYNAQQGTRLGVSNRERETVLELAAVVQRLDQLSQSESWVYDSNSIDQLEIELSKLQQLAGILPEYLYQNLRDAREDAKGQYRTLIGLTWFATVLAAAMLSLFIRLFYQWVFRPLRVLIKGSRKVAGGSFDYRIELDTDDEMSELADALNDMTARFRTIRDDLDRQVQLRTKQVVRSEQLASVGFLAAGVAHEINNPLASIAMCAESLEGRFGQSLSPDDPDQRIVLNYLRMIQDEAFRCKEITEKLLDFSRLGEVQHSNTELRELIQGVIDMVGHLGKYHDKQVHFEPGTPVIAPVNTQELKQVILNLLTNGLDSLDPGGTVTVELRQRDEQAEITFRDNGCGMSPEVLEHLFEPFFTRRRGGQGTGLGLSITYRIVADHGGHIDAASDGPGCGSRFTVTLPLVRPQKETFHRYQAA